MSRIVYATQIGCDWPDCEATGTVPETGKDQWKSPPPEGWTSFAMGSGPQGPFGSEFRDFCPRHAIRLVSDLAELCNRTAVKAAP